MIASLEINVMAITSMTDFLLFIALVAGGVFSEVVIFKLIVFFVRPPSSTMFHLIKYCYLLSLPTLAVLVTMQRIGIVVLYVFITTSLVGPLFEWLAGFTYEYIVGKRLWTYHHYGMSQYTSILAIPLWGFAGVLLWLVGQLFR
jgi:hypothetical protein